MPLRPACQIEQPTAPFAGTDEERLNFLESGGAVICNRFHTIHEVGCIEVGFTGKLMRLVVLSPLGSTWQAISWRDAIDEKMRTANEPPAEEIERAGEPNK